MADLIAGLNERLFKTIQQYPAARHALEPLLNRSLASGFDAKQAVRLLILWQNDRLARPTFNQTNRFLTHLSGQGVDVRAQSALATTEVGLIKSATHIVYQPSMTSYHYIDIDPLKRIREINPDAKITFCDWFAPCDIRFGESVDPFVDLYTKKSLLHDRSLYITGYREHTNLMAFYSRLTGATAEARTWVNPPSILPKLRITPAFGTSDRLYRFFAAGRPRPLPRPIDVHARFDSKGTDWYSQMRVLARNSLPTGGGLKTAVDQTVGRRQFLAELRRSKLCFSPFGYGELCWRDFEAFAFGAVLIKPDMSHLDVYGDVFKPWETYIPVNWDFSDLRSSINDALGDQARLERIADNAFSAVRRSMSSGSLTKFISDFLI